MIELVIKKTDGSVYWREFFNSQTEADMWIAEEQTRSYWDPTYYWEFIDHSPTEEQIAEQQAVAEAAAKAKKDAIDAILAIVPLTPEQITALFGA